MSELTKHRFSELYSMSSGISSSKDQAGHGSPFLSFSIVFNNYFVPDELLDLMDTSEKEKEKYSIKQGDIFLTRTSEVVDELAMSCVAIKDYADTSFSGFLKRLRPTQDNITYPKFMAFYLRSPMFRRTMTNNAVMTLRASLNEAIFSYLELLLPKYDEQVKVGELLYLLSEKTDLNDRINTELEAVVKNLYEYWFVQFDFPDANGKPYKSSGGTMQYNKRLKREVPSGWADANLGEYITLERGVTYGRPDVLDQNGDEALGVLRATNLTGNFVDVENLVYLPKSIVNASQRLKHFDTLMVMSSGSKEHVGKNGIYFFREQVGFGAFCSKIVPKNQTTFFINSFLQSKWFKTYIRNQCLGTNINNLTGNHIIGCDIVSPPPKLIQTFESRVRPIFEQISANRQENQSLTSLRDWLLPMLMNGQVTVTSPSQTKDQAADA
ncbi:restriction endonuclease subunit S [Granulosicoccus sp.]|nr:restriction endonuclease subunit S [Granulosicoccus sp.]MDB4222782.1 restriction endonuclease subunit S [Granulosicoccus sp.]